MRAQADRWWTLREAGGVIPENPDFSAVATKLAALRLAEQTLPTVLQAVADGAKRAMPEVVEASVEVVEADGASTFAQTGLVTPRLGAAQKGSDHPRRVDVAYADTTIEVPDMRGETRWPTFTRSAADLGVLSWLSVPLPVLHGARGSLDIWSTQVDGIGPSIRSTATAFVRHTGAVVCNMHSLYVCQTTTEDLRATLAEQAPLERAHGVLMGRFGMSLEEARIRLQQRARRSNTDVHDLAAMLLADTARGDFSDAESYRPPPS